MDYEKVFAEKQESEKHRRDLSKQELMKSIQKSEATHQTTAQTKEQKYLEAKKLR